MKEYYLESFEEKKIKHENQKALVHRLIEQCANEGLTYGEAIQVFEYAIKCTRGQAKATLISL